MNVALSLDENIAFLFELKPRELAFVIEESVLAALNNMQDISFGLPGMLNEQDHKRVGIKRVKIMNPSVYGILQSLKTGMRGSFVSQSISDYFQSPGGAILMENLKARLNPYAMIHLKERVIRDKPPEKEKIRKIDDKDHFLKRLEGDFA